MVSKQNISLHENFTITLVTPDAKDFKISNFPEITDFSKKETEFNKKDSLIFVTQNYKPRRKGSFYLYPFSLSLTDTTVHFNNTLLINVSALPIAPQQMFKEKNNPEEEGYISYNFKSKLTLSIASTDVYEGEPIEVSVSLLLFPDNKSEYNFINLKDQLQKLKESVSLKNCLTEYDNWGEIITDTINQGSEKILRFKLIKAQLTPLSPGNLRFDSVSFSVLTYLKKRTPGKILRKDKVVTLKTTPAEIRVQKIPSGYKNLIPGQFRLQETISNKEATAGKSFTYTFTVTGNGNLSMISNPQFIEQEDIEVYSKSTFEDNKKKSFSYYIVSNKTGKLELEDLFYWPYFNTQTGKADTLRPGKIIHIIGSSRFLKSYKEDPFYKKIDSAGHKLQRFEEDNMIKLFTNLVILFMFAVTVLLIIRK